MRRPLLLVAASGLAREVAAAVRAAERHEVVGFLDDDASQWGTEREGIPILGGIDEVGRYPDADLLLCAGRGASRAAIARRLAEHGVSERRYATVVHPSVEIAPSCSVGVGSVLLAQVVLTTAVSVGKHVVVMPHVTLTHDNVLADHVTIAAGVALGGWVQVGENSYLGMSSSVREKLRIGRDATVGMGAVVVSDVADASTVVGNPARRLRSATGSSEATTSATQGKSS